MQRQMMRRSLNAQCARVYRRRGSSSAFRSILSTRPVTMHFLLTPSAVTSQAVAAAGADAVTIDLEHGPIDFKDAQAMIASVMGTHTLPMIRVPSIDPVSVKRSLDLGAEGIVFPLARNAADVSRAVSTLHYPPRGERGFGPFIAHSAHRFEIGSTISYYEKNPPICCILVETVEAVQNIDEIADVDGVDIFQIAQFDLSTSLGVPGQFDHPTFLNAERKVEEAILRRGKSLGAVALTHARAQELRARGYSMLVGFDVHWLKSSIQTAQTWVLPAQ